MVRFNTIVRVGNRVTIPESIAKEGDAVEVSVKLLVLKEKNITLGKPKGRG